MPDIVDAATRSRMMSGIRGKNTKPEMLLRRVDGVLKLKDSKLLMFRARRDAVAELARLLPDADPLVQLPDDGGHLRLQTMCHGALTWQRLEDLERAGAQGLMVLSVERSLA